MSTHTEEKRIVEQLSAAMMTKLALNRHKSTWLGERPDHLLELARNKLSALNLALYGGRTKDAVMDCADAANYLAMIVDIALADIRRGKIGGG